MGGSASPYCSRTACPPSARDPLLERLQYTEPEMQDTDLVFEDFLLGRAEKYFADIDDEGAADVMA